MVTGVSSAVVYAESQSILEALVVPVRMETTSSVVGSCTEYHVDFIVDTQDGWIS